MNNAKKIEVGFTYFQKT